MRMLALCSVLALAMSFTSGCKERETVAAPAEPASGDPQAAQPRLKTMKLWMGPEEMIAEVAVTMSQVRTGMMWRTNMAENEGMLFVFSTPHQAGFWMKNTPLPLSAAYIDPSGKILELHDLQPGDTNTALAASSQVQYVLETRQGWFKRHNITPGVVVRTEVGSFHDTFFRNR